MMRLHIYCVCIKLVFLRGNIRHAVLCCFKFLSLNYKIILFLPYSEAEARNCATPRIQSCVSALESAISQAGEDKEKRCSDGYIYLECVTKVGTYCDLDVGQALMEVNKMLSQDGCVNDSGNGAGSIIFTFFVMCFKLTLYKVV